MYGLNDAVVLIDKDRGADSMSECNLAYDYSAILILITMIIWYFLEKRIPLKSHRFFLIYILSAFGTTVIEVLSVWVLRYSDIYSETLFHWMLALRALAFYSVSFILLNYVALIGNVNINKWKYAKPVLWVLYAFTAVASLINPFTRWAFDYKNNRFESGNGNRVLAAITVGLSIATVAIIIKNVKELQLRKTIVLIISMCLCGFAAVYQERQNELVFCLSMTLVCLTLYNFLQNPNAVTDLTTSLFNRNFMGDYLKNEFASGRSFGVITVAMDDFKFINRTHGINVGDRLLFQVGSFLTSLEVPKMVFRFGSDQFCVVIKKSNVDIYKTAETIVSRFKHPWFSDTSAAIMMSASVCCIECPRDAASYGELVEVIDYSTAVMKKSRKGSLGKADELELEKLKKDKEVEKAIKLAVDRDEVMVYYQPIFSVQKDVYNSAEALVRINDEKLGFISPEIFIPIAEKNGLIIEMGELILRKVCKFIHDFELRNTSVEYIEVNISPVQLCQTDFVDRVKSILEEYDVEPSQINMEITETANVSSMKIINENIAALVNYGISFSLDDYGSGNANIDYINRMPFTIIKLDKYIIWEAFKNEKAGITLEHTVGMLNALKLYIVAEGVETEEMKEQLAKVGCHYMQGWYYSKAVPAADFIGLIQNTK